MNDTLNNGVPPIEENYTPEEVARILKYKSKYTVYTALKEGRIRGFKLGTRWRVPRSELEKLMSLQTGETGDAAE